MKKVYYTFFLTFTIACFSYGQQWAPSGTNISNTNAGNVGIGTVSPFAPLTIIGRNNEESPSIPKVLAVADPDARESTISLGYSVPLDAGVIASVRNSTGWKNTYINPYGGNIGIGTTNPGSYRLAVEGKISARYEIRIFDFGIPFPDYVFQNTYKLRPLPEVETFIKVNNHLPEIPSAQEVECNGMNLVEMNVLMLKKVEELTLHLIEQNKQVIEQNKQIEVLKQENEALKLRVDNLEEE